MRRDVSTCIACNPFYARRSKPLNVIVSLITLAAFLFTAIPADISWAVTTSAGLAHVTLDRVVSPGLSKELNAATFSLPEHLGHIKDSWKASSPPPPGSGLPTTIIHIQDAHCNYFAQHKIAQIIDYLNSEHGFDIVNMEGGYKDYDLTIFTRISNESLREKVSDNFVKEGLISGGEYFAINNPDKIKLWGVEDVNLYLENLNVYKDSLKNKEAIDKSLRALNHILSNLKRHIYSKELFDLDLKYVSYKEDNLAFKDYLIYLVGKAKSRAIDIKGYRNLYLLCQTLEQEDKIDFKKANSERDALIDKLQRKLSKRELETLVLKTLEFKTEKISQQDFYSYVVGKARSVSIDLEIFPDLEKYVIYISLYNAIDKASVIDELEALESGVKEAMNLSEEEKYLSVLSKNLALLKNIFNISLTRNDYKYYLANRSAFDMKNYTSFIDRHAVKYNITAQLDEGTGDIDMYRDNITKFYECSLKRDGAFMKNMIYKESGARIAIVVTGGFHTENLARLFKASNISYISIMPNFKNPDDYESPYFRLLAGEMTGLEKRLHSAIKSTKTATIQIASMLTALCQRVWPDDQVKARILMAFVMEQVLQGKRVELTGDSGEVLFEYGAGPASRMTMDAALDEAMGREVLGRGEAMPPTGREGAIDYISANDGAWVGFMDMAKAGLRNAVYGRPVMDIVIDEVLQVVTDVLQTRYGGHVFRIAGDEIGFTLPVTMSRDEVRNALTEVQTTIRDGFSNIASIDRMTGRMTEEGVPAGNITKFRENLYIPLEPAGCVKLSGVSDKMSAAAAGEASTHGKLLDTYLKYAEIVQGRAKEEDKATGRVELVRVEEDFIAPEKTEPSILSDAEKAKIADARERMKAVGLEIEEEYPSFKRGALWALVNRAAEDRTPAVYLARGPPDTFYIIRACGNGKVQALKIVAQYIARNKDGTHSDFTETAFQAILHDSGRTVSRRSGDVETYYGFKAPQDASRIYENTGHQLGNDWINLENLGILNAFTASAEFLNEDQIMRALKEAVRPVNSHTIKDDPEMISFEVDMDASVVTSDEIMVGEAGVAKAIMPLLEQLDESRNSVVRVGVDGVEKSGGAAKTSPEIKSYARNRGNWSEVKGEIDGVRKIVAERSERELAAADEKLQRSLNALLRETGRSSMGLSVETRVSLQPILHETGKIPIRLSSYAGLLAGREAEDGVEDLIRALTELSERYVSITEGLSDGSMTDVNISDALRGFLIDVNSVCDSLALNGVSNSIEEIRVGAAKLKDMAGMFMREYLPMIDKERAVGLEGVIAGHHLSDPVDVSVLKAPIETLIRGAGCRPAISGGDGVAFDGNEIALLQALDNLTVNAVFAAREKNGANGEVDVSFAISPNGTRLSVVVRDNGAGIPEGLPGIGTNIYEKIFERGFTTKGVEGSGWGLYLARLIIERHGGTIRAMNRDDGVTGAQFVVELPLNRQAPPVAAREAAEGSMESLMMQDLEEMGRGVQFRDGDGILDPQNILEGVLSNRSPTPNGTGGLVQKLRERLNRLSLNRFGLRFEGFRGTITDAMNSTEGGEVIYAPTRGSSVWVDSPTSDKIRYFIFDTGETVPDTDYNMDELVLNLMTMLYANYGGSGVFPTNRIILIDRNNPAMLDNERLKLRAGRRAAYVVLEGNEGIPKSAVRAQVGVHHLGAENRDLSQILDESDERMVERLALEYCRRMGIGVEPDPVIGVRYREENSDIAYRAIKIRLASVIYLSKLADALTVTEVAGPAAIAEEEGLPRYTGAGDTSIHVALYDAGAKIEKGEFAAAQGMLKELLKDLRNAQRSDDITALMEKWNPRYPSDIEPDLLIDDLGKAISEVGKFLGIIIDKDAGRAFARVMSGRDVDGAVKGVAGLDMLNDENGYPRLDSLVEMMRLKLLGDVTANAAANISRAMAVADGIKRRSIKLSKEPISDHRRELFRKIYELVKPKELIGTKVVTELRHIDEAIDASLGEEARRDAYNRAVASALSDADSKLSVAGRQAIAEAIATTQAAFDIILENYQPEDRFIAAALQRVLTSARNMRTNNFEDLSRATILICEEFNLKDISEHIVSMPAYLNAPPYLANQYLAESVIPAVAERIESEDEMNSYLEANKKSAVDMMVNNRWADMASRPTVLVITQKNADLLTKAKGAGTAARLRLEQEYKFGNLTIYVTDGSEESLQRIRGMVEGIFDEKPNAVGLAFLDVDTHDSALGAGGVFRALHDTDRFLCVKEVMPQDGYVHVTGHVVLGLSLLDYKFNNNTMNLTRILNIINSLTAIDYIKDQAAIDELLKGNIALILPRITREEVWNNIDRFIIMDRELGKAL